MWVWGGYHAVYIPMEDDDSAECKYAELDNPSGRENEVFSSLEDMVEKILSDALSQ